MTVPGARRRLRNQRVCCEREARGRGERGGAGRVLSWPKGSAICMAWFFIPMKIVQVIAWINSVRAGITCTSNAPRVEAGDGAGSKAGEGAAAAATAAI